MIHPYAALALIVVTAAASLAAMLSGSPWLERPLPGGLPLGNLLAAVFVLAVGAAAMPLAPRTGIVRRLALLALAAAAAWLPISVLLAGNVALNFADGRGDVWLLYTAGVVVVAMVAVVVALTVRIASHRRRVDST